MNTLFYGTGLIIWSAFAVIIFMSLLAHVLMFFWKLSRNDWFVYYLRPWVKYDTDVLQKLRNESSNRRKFWIDKYLERNAKHKKL